MQTEKKATTQEAAAQAAQAAQATLCRTTVIAGMDAFDDRTARLVALVKSLGHRGRFDLLTVPDAARLPADRQLFNQVARDAALAIKLHHGEQIVVAVYGDPRETVELLKRRPEFSHGGVEISGLDLRGGKDAAPPPNPSIAVTCMDFRQHDAHLPIQLRNAFDLPGTPSVLATAGGAKEVVDGHPRGRRIIRVLKTRDRLRPIERIVVTCHTDCGAMGGDAAPDFCIGGKPDYGRQLKVLRQHLMASVLSLRVAFPKVQVEAGIVELQQGRIKQVIRDIDPDGGPRRRR